MSDDNVAVDGDEQTVPQRAAGERHGEFWVQFAHGWPRSPLLPHVRVDDEDDDEAQGENIVQTKAHDEHIDDVPHFFATQYRCQNPQVPDQSLEEKHEHDSGSDRCGHCSGQLTIVCRVLHGKQRPPYHVMTSSTANASLYLRSSANKSAQ